MGPILLLTALASAAMAGEYPLLTYFDDDVTAVKKPKMKEDVESAIKQDADGLPDLDEKPKDMTLAARRARDPDGQFAWEGGTLRCAVRRHDYRVFLVTERKRGQESFPPGGERQPIASP